MALVNIYVNESGFIWLHKALGKAAAGRHWTVKQATYAPRDPSTTLRIGWADKQVVKQWPAEAVQRSRWVVV